MSQVVITESNLTNIANAIRGKNGSSDQYTPAQMATAIQNIPTGITPTGTVNITQNGTVDVTQYASAVVNVSGGGGGGLPLGIATSQYAFADLGLTWDNIAEENVA